MKNERVKIIMKIVITSSLVLTFFFIFMIDDWLWFFSNERGETIVELPNYYRYICRLSNDCIIGIRNSGEATLSRQIVEFAYNDRYLIAKQYGLKSKNSDMVVDKTKVYYWILDTKERIKYGPYELLEQFEKKKKEFNIENLELKPASSYKKTIETPNYIDFGKNFTLFQSFYSKHSYMLQAIIKDGNISGHSTLIDYIIKYRNIKKNNSVYLISRKEKDSNELRYTIVNYKTEKYTIYESFNDLSEADKKIFKEESKFKNTEI